MTDPELDARIAEAYDYAFAPHDLARTRWNATFNPANPQRFDVNTLSHARRLLDHRDRWITMPNNDTLYSIAWLDLSGGPVVFSYPAMDERYFSFAFLDPFTDNTAIVSRRTSGGSARRLWIAPPGWTGAPPDDVTVLRVAAFDLWLLGRVLVDGAPDVPAVHALQDAMRLDAAGGARAWSSTPDELDPRAFLIQEGGALTVVHRGQRVPLGADLCAYVAAVAALDPPDAPTKKLVATCGAPGGATIASASGSGS